MVQNRNFDPSSRTLRKHALDDAIMQDTVEKNVEGLAENIIAEDEKRRAQELASKLHSVYPPSFLGVNAN